MLSGNDNDNNNNTASIQLTHWTGLMTEFDLSSHISEYSVTSLPAIARCLLLCPHFAILIRSLLRSGHCDSPPATRLHYHGVCENIGCLASQSKSTSAHHNSLHWLSLWLHSLFRAIVYALFYKKILIKSQLHIKCHWIEWYRVMIGQHTMPNTSKSTHHSIEIHTFIKPSDCSVHSSYCI